MKDRQTEKEAMIKEIVVSKTEEKKRLQTIALIQLHIGEKKMMEERIEKRHR